jgi:hypothetical protein
MVSGVLAVTTSGERLTVVGGDRERLAVTRRARGKTLRARYVDQRVWAALNFTISWRAEAFAS